MNGNPFLQTDSLGSVTSRSKTIVRQKYVAPQPSQDYFEPTDENVHGDFSEFEGKNLGYTCRFYQINSSSYSSCTERNS
jgi:hypothetical protein